MVSLAGIEPAPLLAQRALYTKGGQEPFHHSSTRDVLCARVRTSTSVDARAVVGEELELMWH